ncbi:sugar glycosyltransferase [Mangrovibacter sp. SLW1]
MGTFTKQIYRYTHKRNMRHNENLWPFLKIRRNETGEIVDFRYKNNQVNITPLSQLHQAYNDSILLFATGPSINEMDLSKLPLSLPVIGVNGAWHLHNQVSFSLYIIVDMTFIDKKPELVEEIILSEKVHFFTTAHGIIKVIQLFGKNNIKCKISIIEDICYRTYMPSIKKDAINKSLDGITCIQFHSTVANIAYSNDIRAGIFDTGTVAYWALQLLVFLGFKKYILPVLI